MLNKFNLTVAIMCLLILASFTDAQRTRVPAGENLPALNGPETRVSVKMQTVAKYHMVVSVYETKDLFTETRSKDEFVATLMKLYGKSTVSEPFKEYLGAVYGYHERGTDSDQIWQQERGDAFARLNNQIVRVVKKGTSKRDIQRQLFPDFNFESTDLKKPWWVNPLRKVIDFIDDHWK